MEGGERRHSGKDVLWVCGGVRQVDHLESGGEQSMGNYIQRRDVLSMSIAWPDDLEHNAP